MPLEDTTSLDINSEPLDIIPAADGLDLEVDTLYAIQNTGDYMIYLYEGNAVPTGRTHRSQKAHHLPVDAVWFAKAKMGKSLFFWTVGGNGG